MPAFTFVIRKGDTRPIIKATLSDANGALNLTGTTVKLALRNTSTGAIQRLSCTLTDASNGRVERAWLAADTAAEANYDATFEVTYTDLSILSVPSDDYGRVVVSPNIMAA